MKAASPSDNSRYQLLIKVILVLLLLILVLPVYKFLTKNMKVFSGMQNGSDYLKNDRQLTINGITISVEVADTPQKQAQGLSNKEKISDSEGMLFLFDRPDYLTFWMKDMNFPLDFIWINSGKVVDLTKNVPNPDKNTPVNTLQLYKPAYPANEVLEVNSGFIDKNNIEVGNEVIISNI